MGCSDVLMNAELGRYTGLPGCKIRHHRFSSLLDSSSVSVTAADDEDDPNHSRKDVETRILLMS
jgi:hypothetical protein